ncbi:MAG: bifunctional diguanylate cyclase/phosphodiesterase [Pseudomonadota bacterium]
MTPIQKVRTANGRQALFGVGVAHLGALGLLLIMVAGQPVPGGMVTAILAGVVLLATFLLAARLASPSPRNEPDLVSRLNTAGAQQVIQSMILHGAALEDTLERVCRLVETFSPGTYCAVLLTDRGNGKMALAAAPNLPTTFREAIESLPVSTDHCACSRAARLGEPVFTEDIAADSGWTGLREAALQNGLRACFAYPLLSTDDVGLGAFAVYCTQPGPPTAENHEQMPGIADLVSLAVERHRDREALEEKEQRFRSLFRYHPDAVLSLDRDGRIEQLNPVTEEALGHPADDLIGRSFAELVDHAHREATEKALRLASDGHSQWLEMSVTHAEGGEHQFDLTCLPIVIHECNDGIYAIARDITSRKRQESRLRILERSVEASMHGVVIVDARRPDLPIIYSNAAFSRITGYSPEEVKGRNCRFLQDGETDRESIEEIRRGLREQRPVHVLIRNRRKDGSLFWNELHIAPVEDDRGNMTHFVGLQNDVTAQKSYEKQLAFNATHDALTGLSNRALFEDRLRQMASLSRRHRNRVAVLFIDLDEFKPINDSLGHAVGDRILMEVAKRLSDQMRTEDTLARFGGDEFVALLTDIQDETEASEVAERLLPTIARPYRLEGRELYLSASIGIAISDPGMNDPLGLIRRADMAMYRAKQQGHNTSALYSGEINSQMRRRLGLRSDLQEAIEAEDFELHYQPLVDGKDQRVVGMEALLRWNHPRHGPISPGTFIPLAEETGQIIPLSEWVLDRACQHRRALHDRGLGEGRMAINLSPVQFSRANFLETVTRSVERHGLPAWTLELELTERILMNDTEAAIEVLNRLREQTIKVAIDDFGTGFSSLSYLKKLPVDSIKIDQSFTRQVETSEADMAIIQGTVSMAHHLGLNVVAEGVETEAQKAILTEYGCDILQGYLFARPMPFADLVDHLERKGQITPST